MHYIFPDYYHKFSCIAGKCPASCCITDWEIEIDPETREYYDNVEEPIGDKIRSLMLPADCADSGEGSAVIRVTANHRCPFLTRRKLCEIYQELGPDALCQTCREYPRYFGEAGDLMQVDLSLSCPEVARLFFFSKDIVHYETKSDIMDGEELSKPEEELLEKVTAFRDRFIFSPEEALRRLEETPVLRFQVLHLLMMTEPFSPRWKNALRHISAVISSLPKELPSDILPLWARARLMQYFIFRYSMDVMYGSSFGDVIRLTKNSLAAISLLFVSKWRPNAKISCRKIPGVAENCTDEQIRLMDIAVLYSRQMEHSEENMDILTYDLTDF